METTTETPMAGQAEKPTPKMYSSVFADAHLDWFQYRWDVCLIARNVHGGIPANSDVAEAWIESKLGDTDDILRAMVAGEMVEHGKTMEEAVDDVKKTRALQTFRRDEVGPYIGGYQVKAMIKEAANSNWPKDRWGPSKKGTRSHTAEHIYIPEDRIHLRTVSGTPEEPLPGDVIPADDLGIVQSFPKTRFGTGISLHEVVEECMLCFSVMADHDYEKEMKGFWSNMWVKAETLGIGARRSQSAGTFTVVRWDQDKS